MNILIPLEGPSVSGLQAKELMGLTVNSINELSDSDVKDFTEFYGEIYLRAFRALCVDVQKVLSGTYRYPDGTLLLGRFNINKKGYNLDVGEFVEGSIPVTGLVNIGTVETDLSEYSVATLSYVKFFLEGITNPLPTDKVTVIITNSVGDVVKSQPVLLLEGTTVKVPIYIPLVGEETYTIELDFNGKEVVIQTTTLANSLFDYSKVDSCRCPCGSDDNNVLITQSTGGLVYHIEVNCSLERFVLQNIALLRYSLYYSIGREFMKDRITTDRINQYTVLTIDRATQLLEMYEKDYINSLDTLRDIRSILEDDLCFECRQSLTVKNLLP
jgi:hypothetical protein